MPLLASKNISSSSPELSGSRVTPALSLVPPIYPEDNVPALPDKNVWLNKLKPYLPMIYLGGGIIAVYFLFIRDTDKSKKKQKKDEE